MFIGSLQRFLPAKLKVRKVMIMALSEAAHLEVALVESTSQLWTKGNTGHGNISIMSIRGAFKNKLTKLGDAIASIYNC